MNIIIIKVPMVSLIVRIKERQCLKLRVLRPDLSAAPKPSWQRHQEDVTTYPTSLAYSGTPRLQLGSHRREHNHTSSDSLAQTCPSAHVNKRQRAKNRQGDLFSVGPTQSVTQNATLTMCWHGKDKRSTRPKALMRAHRRRGKGWKAGQHFPWLSGLNWYVLLNYLSYDLCISFITERSVNM